MEKPLHEITRSEWVKYQWYDVTQMGDAERIMAQGLLRMPDEAYIALGEWEATAEDRGVEDEPEPEEEKGEKNSPGTATVGGDPVIITPDQAFGALAKGYITKEEYEKIMSSITEEEKGVVQ